MAKIDTNGIMTGIRMDQCPDYAKLLFPFIYFCADARGRMELTINRIRGTGFVDFETTPSEGEIRSSVDCYQEASLLVAYNDEHHRRWLQWDTSVDRNGQGLFLTKREREYPAPPEDMWREFLSRPIVQRDNERIRILRSRDRAKYVIPGWHKIRPAILFRDQNICAYCGLFANTVDHIYPKIRGGDESDSNLVAACKNCNSTKHDRTPQECGMIIRFRNGAEVLSTYDA